MFRVRIRTEHAAQYIKLNYNRMYHSRIQGGPGQTSTSAFFDICGTFRRFHERRVPIVTVRIIEICSQHVL